MFSLVCIGSRQLFFKMFVLCSLDSQCASDLELAWALQQELDRQQQQYQHSPQNSPQMPVQSSSGPVPASPQPSPYTRPVVRLDHSLTFFVEGSSEW